MADTTDQRATEDQAQERDRQGSAGQSGRLDDDELRHEQKTPDGKGRTIEHGAEEYYRQHEPEAEILELGAEPQSPGKSQQGRSAT